MTSVMVMSRLLLLLLFYDFLCTTWVSGQLPFGKAHLKLPGQGVLSSLLPAAAGQAAVGKTDDKYLVKAKLGANELKLFKVGSGSQAAVSQQVLSSPAVSPDVLVSI